MKPSRPKFKRVLGVMAAGVAAATLLVFAAGELLSHPALHSVGQPPALLKGAQTLNLASAGQSPLGAWLVPGQTGQGVVLLLHGVRADRLAMVERAKFLNQSGYTVLLMDLPAHGESPAEHITFGQQEALGVRTALSFLSQHFPHERLGVIGVSLGAASLVLAHPDPAPDALVLESMFPSIHEAVTDRVTARLGAWSAPLASLLLWQLPVRLGVYPDQLRPIDDIKSLHAPILISSGSADLHTTEAETRRIFAAAPGPKQLWIVDGAAHVDLHEFDPSAYESRVGAFLAQHLRGP